MEHETEFIRSMEDARKERDVMGAIFRIKTLLNNAQGYLEGLRKMVESQLEAIEKISGRKQ